MALTLFVESELGGFRGRRDGAVRVLPDRRGLARLRGLGSLGFWDGGRLLLRGWSERRRAVLNLRDLQLALGPRGLRRVGAARRPLGAGDGHDREKDNGDEGCRRAARDPRPDVARGCLHGTARPSLRAYFAQRCGDRGWRRIRPRRRGDWQRDGPGDGGRRAKGLPRQGDSRHRDRALHCNARADRRAQQILGDFNGALDGDAEQHRQLRGPAAEPLRDRQNLRPELFEIDDRRTVRTMLMRNARDAERARPDRAHHVRVDLVEVRQRLAQFLNRAAHESPNRHGTVGQRPMQRVPMNVPARVTREGAEAGEEGFGMNAFLILKRTQDAIQNVLGPGIHPVLTVHLAPSMRPGTLARSASARQTVGTRRQPATWYGPLRDESTRREVEVFRLMVAALLLASAAAIHAKTTKCTSLNSAPTTVPQIAADPDEYVGRCVAIEGVMQRMFLFESVDGVYLQPRDGLNPASNGFRLGLDHIVGHFSERYRRVAILGRVQDCETVRSALDASAGPGDLVWVSGYCHYYNGPYLWVHDVQYRSGRPFERRMGSYERKDYGDLEPAPDNWPHRAQVEALASDFLRALRTADRERLAGMHFRDVGDEWPEEEAAMLRFLLRDGRSPFASIRTGRVPPQHIILVERSRLYPEADEPSADEKADYSALVCFCRAPSCDGRWPIATFDADNVPGRPYACTRVDPYLVDRESGREVPHFTTNIGTGGLAEPRAR